MRERGEIDPHERDEGAEIQHLGAELIGERQAAGERHRADQKDVVARNVAPRIDDAEES